MKPIRVADHTFVPSLLKAGSTVLDCGVNRGEFARWFVNRLDCRVVGFEPDPYLYKTLADVQGFEVYRYAIGGHVGEVPLYLGQKTCSSTVFKEVDTEALNVPMITIEDVVNRYDIERIDLLKLDIEGAEIELLERIGGAFLRDHVVQVTVEFHDWLDSSQVANVDGICARLRKHGFFGLCFSITTRGDYLFINRHLASLRRIDRAALHVAKWRMAAVRKAMSLFNRATQSQS